jgi:ubiquinone/menaquinone biosynthesis C-methylase UbiE/DNA-binding transcriptional ArsR family regulator
MKKIKAPKAVAERLSALSEPVRLRLLRLLEAEELTVGEVAKVVQMPQSTVSRQLKILGESGWLARRSEGTATLYRLVLDDLGAWDRSIWLAVRTGMGDDVEVKEDLRRLKGVVAARRLDSQAFFGKVAGEWDQVRNELFGRGFTGQALLGLLPREWVVADVGCGTGNASEIIAPWVQRVIAVDRSEPMLAAARARLAGLGNVEFVLGDVDRLPFKDGRVDAAVCILVLHHVEDPAGAAREMARIVRPGGLVLVVDMVEHGREEYRRMMGHVHLGFARETIEGIFAEAGLSEARWAALPSDPDGRGPGLFVATGRKA